MKKLIILSGPKGSGKSQIINAFKIIADGDPSFILVEEFKSVKPLWDAFELSSSVNPEVVHVFSTQLDVFDHHVPKYLKAFVHIINCRNRVSESDEQKSVQEKDDLIKHLYSCLKEQIVAIEQLHKQIPK